MLTISHIELKDANAYVTAHHRLTELCGGTVFLLPVSRIAGCAVSPLWAGRAPAVLTSV